MCHFRSAADHHPQLAKARCRGTSLIRNNPPPWQVVSEAHGTDPGDPVRYDVNFGHKAFLGQHLRKGAEQIKRFLATVSAAQIQPFLDGLSIILHC